MFANAATAVNGIDARFYDGDSRLDVARQLFPDMPEPWIDLSTAASPFAPALPSLSPGEMTAYPDAPALQGLADAVRRAYRAPVAAEIVPVPQAAMAIGLLPWLFREPKRVAVLAPAHSGHAAAWEAAGHSVSNIASLDQAGRFAILIVVNPSQVDGRFIDHAALARALPPLKRRDGILIVDETFADWEPSHSILPAVGRLDYTVVLRSLDEFYGTGGLGLGFAITSHPISGRIRSALGTSPITAPALAFAQEALTNTNWAETHRARLRDAGSALDVALEAGGLRAAGGTALFRLAGCGAPGELFRHLASRGILTRPFRERAALRFGFPKSDQDLTRLREALHNFSA